MQTSLLKWQNEALESWVRAGMRGVVVAPTGSGKTLLGVAAAKVIRASGNCLVCVHTEALMQQWVKILEFELSETVGRIGAGCYELKPLTVAIINSIRDRQMPFFSGIIIDEIHHLPSEKNIGLLANNSFRFVLGLTSTYERQDDRHEVLKAFGLSIIHTLDYEEARTDRLLSRFEVVNVAVGLTQQEAEKNTKYSDFIDRNLPAYNYDIRSIIKFLATDERARVLMRCIQARKQILAQAQNKIFAVARIALLEAKTEHFKAIIFSEYIENAEAIRLQLEILGFKVGIYHSQQARQERDDVLSQFRQDNVSVLISCKALEEGLDVPNANIGIIVCGSGVKRQIIQRLGRILRHVPGKTARLYQVYAADTQDEKWQRKRTAVISAEADSIKTLVWRD